MRSLLCGLLLCFSSFSIAKEDLTTTYYLSMGAPKFWLPIVRFFYSQVAEQIPNTNFVIDHYPKGRVLKDIINGELAGDIGWVINPKTFPFDKLLVTETPLARLKMTLVTNQPELFANKGFADLEGLKIAFPRGAEYIPDELPQSSRYEVAYIHQAFKMLRRKRVHGVLTTEQGFYKIIKTKKETNYSVIKHLYYMIELKPIFHKNKIKLRDEVEMAMKKLKKAGIYKEMKRRTQIDFLIDIPTEKPQKKTENLIE